MCRTSSPCYVVLCRLDVSAAKAYGLPPGPLLGQLKAGMAVTAPDGTVVSIDVCVYVHVLGVNVFIPPRFLCAVIPHFPACLHAWIAKY